jgi:hypothetical protein
LSTVYVRDKYWSYTFGWQGEISNNYTPNCELFVTHKNSQTPKIVGNDVLCSNDVGSIKLIKYCKLKDQNWNVHLQIINKQGELIPSI